MYQKENIVSQINTCVNFPTNEMNKINLPSKNEVIKHFEENSLKKNEEELKLMDYLECELETRKNLNETVNSLVKEKEMNISKLKDFEKFYSELPNYFNTLENSTLKTQNYLNLNFTNNNRNLNLSGKLPPPLFILYNLLQCFNNEFNECEVNIKGKEEKIDDFYKKYLKYFDYLNIKNQNVENEENEEFENVIREEGEHSEGEIEDEEILEKKISKKKKKKRKNFSNNNFGSMNNNLNNNIFNFENTSEIFNKIASKEEKLIKFPLFVELTIRKPKIEDLEQVNEFNNCYPVVFNFYFIPVLNIITVDLTCKNNSSSNTNANLNSNSNVANNIIGTSNNFTSTFNTNQVLSNIFSPPGTLLTMIKDKIENFLIESCNEYGKNEKLYDYIQILSNNAFYNIKNIREFCKIYLQKNKQLNLNETLLNNQQNFVGNTDSSNSITIDNFISRVRDRFRYLPSLISQIDYLLKYKSLKSEILLEFKNDRRFRMIKEKTNIIDAYKISKTEFYMKYDEIFNPFNENYKISSFFNSDEKGNNLEKIYKKTSTFNYVDSDAFYLCIVFENKYYKIYSYAEIGFDFPANVPRFILSMENSKNNYNNIPKNLRDFINKENNLEDFKSENCGFSDVLRVYNFFM